MASQVGTEQNRDVLPFVQLAAMAADRPPWSSARTATAAAVSKSKGMRSERRLRATDSFPHLRWRRLREVDRRAATDCSSGGLWATALRARQGEGVGWGAPWCGGE
jgi:hypothetical protein